MESMVGCRKQHRFEYVANSERSRRKLTLIDYDADRRVFKAIQTRNAREATMGVRRKDGHYFFVEEAVWMVEAGLASILHRGMQLSVQQCYGLLETFLVAPAKYFVYSYLKRAGYIILPHNALKTSTNCSELVFPDSPKSYFPAELLNQFPTFKSMTLKMACLHRNPKLVEVFDLPEKLSEISTQSFKIDDQSEARRNSKEALRPRYWPKFDKFASRVPSWSDYRTQRAKILKRELEQCSPETTELPLDYDVYAGDGSFSRTLSPSPIYRLLVVGDLNIPLPSVSSLHWLSSQITEGRLLIAVILHSSIIFYDVNHRAVRL